MANKPLWKEAKELQEEYGKRGVGYSYNTRNRNVYLSVLSAPCVAEGVEGCQLTGYLIIYGGVRATRDINKCVEDVKTYYLAAHKDNPKMLKYAKTIN